MLSFSLVFVFVLVVLSSGLFNSSKVKLSGLNQKAIAKELKTIENNKPTKNLEIDKQINNLLSPEKQNLPSLNQKTIKEEMKEIQKNTLKTKELDSLDNTL